jgi:ribosomal-protein-alanine N-acetyltransferase
LDVTSALFWVFGLNMKNELTTKDTKEHEVQTDPLPAFPLCSFVPFVVSSLGTILLPCAIPRMRPHIAIRAAVPADLADVLQIDRNSPTAAHWPESSYRQAIEQAGRLVLVAEESEEVLGFLVSSTATAEWELENIAVAKLAQRQGVGRALLNALIQRAKEAGASEIRQEIRASNLAAQSLGQAVGFVQRGRRKGYYRNPDEDALLFNYLLSGPVKTQ